MIQKKPALSQTRSLSIIALFLAIIINTFSGQINDFVMVGYLESEFEVRSEGFGLMITVFFLGKVVSLYLFGKWSDKIGRKRVLILHNLELGILIKLILLFMSH